MGISNSTVLRNSSTTNNQMFTRNITDISTDETKNMSLKDKVYERLATLGRRVFRKSILAVSGTNIYTCCADKVDYKTFFEICNLPDTFQSWFQVFHLHFWMCYVRLKGEGKEGQIILRQMTECMWQDVKERMKILGVEDSSIMKKSFNELSEQFYGVTLSYNKGLLAVDESEFAHAVWRNLFHNDKKVRRENLDVMLKYIEAQMGYLEDIDSEELRTKGEIDWLPITYFVSKKS
eukprot:gene12287-13552_t